MLWWDSSSLGQNDFILFIYLGISFIPQIYRLLSKSAIVLIFIIYLFWACKKLKNDFFCSNDCYFTILLRQDSISLSLFFGIFFFISFISHMSRFLLPSITVLMQFLIFKFFHTLCVKSCAFSFSFIGRSILSK